MREDHLILFWGRGKTDPLLCQVSARKKSTTFKCGEPTPRSLFHVRSPCPGRRRPHPREATATNCIGVHILTFLRGRKRAGKRTGVKAKRVQALL